MLATEQKKKTTTAAAATAISCVALRHINKQIPFVALRQKKKEK